MNSMISRSILVATALCAVMLVSCDSVKDVHDKPSIPLPAVQDVLSGTFTGVGTARPVVLSWDGGLDCFIADPQDPSNYLPEGCKFYGTAGQSTSAFTFGAKDTGTAYNITVLTQPFGKNCTVANASGTVGSGSPAPVVTCVDDTTNVARYNLTVDVDPSLQSLSNLSIQLTTEDGTWVQDATGQASVSFPGVLFDSQTNLPSFEYKVTATTDTTSGGATTHNFCTFAPLTGFNYAGRNRNPLNTPAAGDPADDSVVVPTGDYSVTVTACSYPVTVNVQYNGAPAQAMGSGGVTLALRNHFTGVDEQTLTVNSFSATPVQFPTALMGNANSIYELRVIQQPVGQTCVVYGTTLTNADTTSAAAGTTSNITAPTASAVLLVDPDNTDWWAYANRSVRCRATPTAPNVLAGTYQMDQRVADAADCVATATHPCFATPGRGREFLTFFKDGTFLYGINYNGASLTASFPNDTFPANPPLRNNAFTSSGVTHGFYTYNSTANTIVFTVFTATNIYANSRGISGMPGYAAGTGNVTASAVALGSAGAGADALGTLSMTFSGNLPGTFGAPTTRLWTMTEPRSIAGEITGTWVTADHLRSFVYDKDLTFAFHIGVNGMGNMQDVCMIISDDSTQSAGIMSKHAGSGIDSSFNYTCTPGGTSTPVSLFAQYNTRTPDLPHYAPKNGTPSLVAGITTPRVAPGFHGRFPGTASQLDNRPTSPIQFSVTPGTNGGPDTLTVQNTLNGVLIEQPITFIRDRATD